jgi:phosphoribosylanthranilate isomerase
LIGAQQPVESLALRLRGVPTVHVHGSTVPRQHPVLAVADDDRIPRKLEQRRLPPQILLGATHPLILAGGLNPGNIGEAVRRLKPFAVDVNSGVELEPGVKDHGLIEAVVREVRKVDAEVSGGEGETA